MRIRTLRVRRLLASGLLGATALVALAPAALAQEGEGETTEEHEISHETEECVEQAIEADDPEACNEAPSPILPPTNELIWGGISFVLLLAAMTKFAFPALKKGMEARTDRIRSDLEGAEAAKADATRVLEEYRAQLADAKAEAGRIIEEARQQADALKKDQEQRLQGELASMRERAAADVESARSQALADLRNDVAALVAEGVDRVVRGGIDAATQQRLIDEYINSLAARAN